jgi:hypothetical protein
LGDPLPWGFSVPVQGRLSGNLEDSGYYWVSVLTTVVLPIVASGFLLLTALGLGDAIYRVARTAESSVLFSLVFRTTLGIGALGWLAFPFASLGYVSTGHLLAISFPFALLGLMYARTIEIPNISPLSGIEWALVTIITSIVLMDGLEAWAPPIDSDSLAYHLAFGKLWLAEEQLVFVPRALDGAVPLLQQIVHMFALDFGGERGLTLWLMATGWLAPLCVYVLVSAHTSRKWALVGAAITATMPAVLYGAGNGQVEIRNAAFVIVASVFALRAIETNAIRFSVIAGLAAGFFVASKYTGLIFATVVFICLAVHIRNWKSGICFGIAVIVAGFQWYLWNWVNTGDPFFPVLSQFLFPEGTPFWNAQINEALMALGVADRPYEKSFIGFLQYLVAVFFSLPTLPDSNRIGVGPAFVCFAPFFLFYIYLAFNSGGPGYKQAMYFTLIGGGVILLWYFAGASQRTRHIVPVMPLLLIALMIAIGACAERVKSIKTVAWAMCLSIVTIQLGGQALFAKKYANFVINGSDRDQFLTNTVRGFEAVTWLQQEVPDSALIVSPIREWNYFLGSRHYLAHAHQEALLTIQETNTEPKKFVDELQALGASHIVSTKDASKSLQPKGYGHLIDLLYDQNCLDNVNAFSSRASNSRTLSFSQSASVEEFIYKINYEACNYVR